MAVDQHYENFPVASLLIPPRIRPYVVAIYRFARYADDVADEGDRKTSERIQELDALANDLRALYAGAPAAQLQFPVVRGLAPLAAACIPGVEAQLFLDLLSAFQQDTHRHRYQTHAELLDYSRRSADPVGRLMLALVGERSPAALRESDAICSALQLINFWQDASIDAERGRIYVPLQDFEQLQLVTTNFPQREHAALMQQQCVRTLTLLQTGRPLLRRLRGRFRFEIALTYAGGERILEKIAANHFDVRIRPTLKWYDTPRLFWLAVRALLTRPSP